MAAGSIGTGLLKDVGEKAGQMYDRYIASWATESAERTLKKMGPQGEVLLNGIKRYEQLWKSGADDLAKKTGLPIDVAHNWAKKDAQDTVFGKDKSFITNQLVNIEKQYKAPDTGAIKKRTAADIVSTYLKEPGSTKWRQKAGVSAASPYVAPKPDGVEKAWSNFAGWIYLSKIAIPHTLQPLNLLLEGRSTAAFGKALFESASNFKAALDQTEKSGALVDEYLHASRYNSQYMKWFDTIFHMPGFKYMRKFQIVTSAIDGKYSAMESAEKYIKSGFQSKAEEVYLRHLGIDPRDIKQYGLRQQDIEKAMYTVAHNAMYIRTGLETPTSWGENSVSRIATQYKGYSYNQGRLILDAFRRAYQMHGIAGIAKVGAIVGALFPIAGEFIWSVDSLVNSGDPTKRGDVLKWLDDGGPIDNYISALAHMAGLGIGYSVMRAANRNAIESYMIGPLGNLISDEFSGLYHGVRSSNFDQFYRTNFHKIPVVGSYLSRELFPTKSQQED
jgi:hypothetical protein